MTDPDERGPDPVFNDVEAGRPLPIGDGEFMPAAELRRRRRPIPEGGEARSSGGDLPPDGPGLRARTSWPWSGVGVIVFMVLFCFVGPAPLPDQPDQRPAGALQNSTQNAPPGNGNPLGTDETGFDILGRLMFGGQASLIVGLASALVATVFGTLYGAISGFFGGWLDSLLMRIVDILLSIPVLFLLIALVTIYHPSEIAAHPGHRLRQLAGTGPAHTRGDAVAADPRVRPGRAGHGRQPAAASSTATSSPTPSGTIVVFATFQVADSILLLAALGFLGLGVPAPQTDWGTMLSNGVDAAGNGYWWQIYPVGLCIVLVVIAFNYVGDALRDSLEVRLQQR